MNESDRQKAIKEHRRQIDTIDQQILALIEKRVRCSIQIQKHKRELNIEAVDEDREKEILDALSSELISDDVVKSVWKELFTHTTQ